MGAMAAEDPAGALLKETKSLVRSLLVPEARGMPTRQLNFEYKEQTGSWLPHNQLKFQNADALLQSMTDILWFKHDPLTGCIVYNVKEAEEDAHVRDLVVGQRKVSAKAKARKRASAFTTRGRGGYRGRGGRGRGRGRGRGWGGSSLLPTPRPSQLLPQRAPFLPSPQSSLMPSRKAPILPTPNFLPYNGTRGKVPNTTSISSASRVNYDKVTKAQTKSIPHTATKTGPVPKIPSAQKVYKETSSIFSNRSSDIKNNSGVSRQRSPIPSSVKNNVVQILQTQRGWIFIEKFCSLYEQKFKTCPDFRSLGYSNISEVLDVFRDIVERQVDEKGNIVIRYLQTGKTVKQDSSSHNESHISETPLKSPQDRKSFSPIFRSEHASEVGHKNSLKMEKQCMSSTTQNFSLKHLKSDNNPLSSVHSSSPKIPLKRTNFPAINQLRTNGQNGKPTNGFVNCPDFSSISNLKTSQCSDTPPKSPQDKKSFSPIVAPGHKPDKKSFSPIFAPEHTPDKESCSPIFASGHTSEVVGHTSSLKMEKQCMSSHATQNLSPVNMKSENNPLSSVHSSSPKTPLKRTNFPFINQLRTNGQYGNATNGFVNCPDFSSIKLPTHIKMESTIENIKMKVAGRQEKYQQMDIVAAQQEDDGWLQIYIAEIYNPHHFYAHVRKNEQVLTKLMEEMMIFYKKPNNLDDYRLLEGDCVVGMPVVSLYDEDHDLFRAIIKRVNDRDTIEVFFVDYGIFKVVKLSKLWYIHRKFFSLPMQVFQARLSGITPAVTNHQWQKNAAERFIEMAIRKPLFAKIKGIEDSAWSLYLVDTTADKDVFVNDELVKEKWALHDGQDEPLPLMDSSIESTHSMSKASLNSYKQEENQMYEDLLINEEMDEIYEQKLQEQYVRQELLKKQLNVCQQFAEQKQLLQERQELDKVLCQEFLQHQKNISKQKIERDLTQNFSCLNVIESQDRNIDGLQAERILQEVQKSQRIQSPNLLTQEVQNSHYNQENLGGNININLHHKHKSNTDDFKIAMEKNLILRKNLEKTVKALYRRMDLEKNMNVSTGNISNGFVGGNNNEIKNENVAHTKMNNTNDPPFTFDQLMLIKEAQCQQNKLTANSCHVGAMNAKPLSPSYDAAGNGLNNFEALNNNAKILYCKEALERKRKEILQQLVANPESDALIVAIKEINVKIIHLRSLLVIGFQVY